MDMNDKEFVKKAKEIGLGDTAAGVVNKMDELLERANNVQNGINGLIQEAFMAGYDTAMEAMIEKTTKPPTT